MSSLYDDTVPMEAEEMKEDMGTVAKMKRTRNGAPVTAIRRSGASNRIVAAPPPPPNHSSSSGVPAQAASSKSHLGPACTPVGSTTGLDRPTSLKRSHASFVEATPGHTEDRERLKRAKAAITPSQVVADQMAQVRIISRASSSVAPSTFTIHEPSSHVSDAMMVFDNFGPIPSAIPSAIPPHVPDSSYLLSPAAPDTASSSSSSIDALDELCSESLDDVDDAFGHSGPQPEDAFMEDAAYQGHSSPSAHPSRIASGYRTYHPAQPLIVSIETALDEYDPDYELNMWDAEQQFQPYLYYLIYQEHLDSTMRPVLIDWMMEVAAEFVLGRETVYLAINYVDRFLSASPAVLPADGPPSIITRKNIQLLGVTCLWLAAKVEEMYPPAPQDFAETTADAYTAQEITLMEPVVLRVLKWRLHAVTPYSWLKLFLKKAALLLYDEFKNRTQVLFESSVPDTPATPATPHTPGAAAAVVGPQGIPQHEVLNRFHQMQRLFLEEMVYLLSSQNFIRMLEWIDILALDMHSLRFYPSHLAAAAIFVLHPEGSPLYTLMVEATTYTAAQLQPCITLLSLFRDVPYVGEPKFDTKFKQEIIMQLKLPYDEFFSRQAHNEHALEALNAGLDSIAAQAKAPPVAAPGGVPVAGMEDGLEAYCHTNIFRNLPAFLAGQLWAELHSRQLVRPIRNAGVHQSPGMWMTDLTARHDDPRTYGWIGLPEMTGLEDYLSPDACQAILHATRQKAAQDQQQQQHQQHQHHQNSHVPAAAAASSQSHTARVTSSGPCAPSPKTITSAAPVAPATDSFMAAASKPYTRLPKDAIRAGMPPPQKLPLPPGATAGAPVATLSNASASSSASTVVQAPSQNSVSSATAGMIVHSTTSAVSASASSTASTTIYTFGGTNNHVSNPHMAAAASSSASTANEVSHPSRTRVPSAAASSSSMSQKPPAVRAPPPPTKVASAPSKQMDEWLTSDEEEEEEEEEETHIDP